jgi:hypothetical protein
MSDGALDILASFAKLHKKRTAATNVYDLNVCRYEVDPKNYGHLKLTSGYPLTRQLRIKYGNYRINLAASPEYLEILLRGKFTAPQISINQPEGNYPLGLQSRVGDLRNGSSKWPVFVRGGASPFGIVEAVLQSATLLNAAQRLLKEPRETLHIHDEGVNLYFKPSSVEEVQPAIETLTSLIGDVGTAIPENPLDRSVFPGQFEDLLPLIRRWGILDDEDRNALLTKSSPAAIRRLVNTVGPHLPAINFYLDSFGDQPLSEAACALGALAECTVEAQLALVAKSQGGNKV